MPEESPGLRPLTIAERGISTLYGSIPSAFVQIALRAVFGVIEQPDYSFWQFVSYVFFGLCRGCEDDVYLAGLGLPHVLGAGMYAMFYFTFGRSLGHMAVNANIVHERTGRPMRTWQKAVRSALQLLVSHPYFWMVMSGISALLVLIDRQRRRSLFDLAAGTVVVIGDLPEEEPEPETAKENALTRALGRLTGRSGAAERR